MKVLSLAAGLSAACLLSACGFVPPKPPMPADTPRVAVNHGDPRQYDRNEATPPAPAPPQRVAIANGESPSEPQPHAQKSAIPASAPVSKPDEPGAKGQPAQSVSPLAIPIPIAPAKTEAAPASKPQQEVKTADASPPAAVHSATPPLAAATSAKPAMVAAAPTDKTGKEEPKAPAAAVPVAAAPTPKTGADIVAAEPIKITAAPIVVKRIWHLGPQDKTVRQALGRWAKDANWTFGPDQWEVAFDLPIEASADFPAASFEEATQALTNSIALTDSPVRPCFYANKVLRIIPFNQTCDRTTAPRARP